ncbi:MAG: GHKL domain-containing protein [Clostridia bacterium]|nr:GHKL domain-containing protein [Clostridia bacterium]MBR2175672.1 GHKL domain-containing protein [Clostridia bacterium]
MCYYKKPGIGNDKKDKDFHGKGIEIIREKAEKHHGHINIYEEDGYFVITVFLSVKILPEN